MGTDTRPEPSPAPPGGLIGRLDEDWRNLVSSRLFRERLGRWAADDPRLAFPDGDSLVAEAQRRDVGDWHHRDRVLAALLERVDRDPVAARVALQVVLPAVKTLIGTVRGWDRDERTSRVVAEVFEVLSRCAHAPAGTAPHYRIYANTRRRVVRAAARDLGEPVTPVPDPADLAHPADAGGGQAGELVELVEWVATRGGVTRRAAGEVVLTRAGGVDVDVLARALDVNPRTLRQRRRRTEQRLQRSLGLER
jgi:hypothetical protein